MKHELEPWFRLTTALDLCSTNPLFQSSPSLTLRMLNSTLARSLSCMAFHSSRVISLGPSSFTSSTSFSLQHAHTDTHHHRVMIEINMCWFVPVSFHSVFLVVRTHEDKNQELTCSQSQQVDAPLLQGSLQWRLIGQVHYKRKKTKIKVRPYTISIV